MQARPRAFNLIEVAVASAIAGIVAAAAVSSFAILNRQLVRLQAESGASDDAKTLVDFLVTDLQAVGGGSVRPWMALWVEDGGDGATAARDANFGQVAHSSDRVTYALVVPDSRSCPITAMTNSEIFTTGNAATCCFFQLGNTDRAGYDDGGDMKMHTVIVKGGASRQVSLEALNNPATGPTTCSMKWKPGPLAGIDNKDGDDELDPVDGDAASVPNSAFVGGGVSAVLLSTIFLDEATHELMAFEERRAFNGTDVNVEADERKRIAGNVFDLQVQLGYDGNPADGRLVDASSVTDEWLYNATSDALPASVSIDDLRMAAVGVVVGVNVKDSAYRSGAKVIGGNLKNNAGFHMRGGMGKAALRNVFVFF
jgi:prepilin-type N-terminal cleavage/methylation domain-containing protein